MFSGRKRAPQAATTLTPAQKPEAQKAKPNSRPESDATIIDVADFYGSMLKIDKDGSSYSYHVYSERTLPVGFTQIGTSNSYELLDSGARVSVIKPYIEEASYTGVMPMALLFGNMPGGVGDITTPDGLQHQFENATDPSNTYSRYDVSAGGFATVINVLSMPNANDYIVRFTSISDEYRLTRERHTATTLTPAQKPEAQKAKPEPQMCCMAVNAQCLACSAGMSEDAYCEKHPGTPGCPKPVSPKPVHPNPLVPTPVLTPKPCCKAMTASCLACSASMTKEDYCHKNPDTSGCPQAKKEPVPSPPSVASSRMWSSAKRQEGLL